MSVNHAGNLFIKKIIIIKLSDDTHKKREYRHHYNSVSLTLAFLSWPSPLTPDGETLQWKRRCTLVTTMWSLSWRTSTRNTIPSHQTQTPRRVRRKTWTVCYRITPGLRGGDAVARRDITVRWTKWVLGYWSRSVFTTTVHLSQRRRMFVVGRFLFIILFDRV